MIMQKKSGPEGPGFGYPQRGFCLLEFIWLMEYWSNGVLEWWENYLITD